MGWGEREEREREVNDLLLDCKCDCVFVFSQSFND